MPIIANTPLPHFEFVQQIVSKSRQKLPRLLLMVDHTTPMHGISHNHSKEALLIVVFNTNTYSIQIKTGLRTLLLNHCALIFLAHK